MEIYNTVGNSVGIGGLVVTGISIVISSVLLGLIYSKPPPPPGGPPIIQSNSSIGD
jgi:hypothetical protein